MQAVSRLNGQARETDSSLKLPEGKKPHLEKQWVGCLLRTCKALGLKRKERGRKEKEGRHGGREEPC